MMTFEAVSQATTWYIGARVCGPVCVRIGGIRYVLARDAYGWTVFNG